MISESFRRLTPLSKPTTTHEKTRESIETDVEKYLKSGGTIKDCGEVERAPSKSRGRVGLV